MYDFTFGIRDYSLLFLPRRYGPFTIPECLFHAIIEKCN